MEVMDMWIRSHTLYRLEDREFSGFDDGLDMENERKKGIRVDFNVRCLSSLKNETTIE